MTNRYSTVLLSLCLVTVASVSGCERAADQTKNAAADEDEGKIKGAVDGAKAAIPANDETKTPSDAEVKTPAGAGAPAEVKTPAGAGAPAEVKTPDREAPK